MSSPYLGRATSRPVTAHEKATWLVDSLPVSLAMPRMRASFLKPHDYQHPIDSVGKHYARAVIGWECQFATTWNVLRWDRFVRVSATMCWDPGLWGCVEQEVWAPVPCARLDDRHWRVDCTWLHVDHLASDVTQGQSLIEPVLWDHPHKPGYLSTRFPRPWQSSASWTFFTWWQSGTLGHL